ncbi:MAG: hypothetical protein JWO82_2440 [Akkermansiaceae bacterium]|nr:hypothetical protein [Akkermansiaceae bacterium]
MKLRISAILAAALFVPAGLHAQGIILGTNLLIDGDAESATGAPEGNAVVAAPGWTTTGNATVGIYAADSSSDSIPALNSPGPKNRGVNLFTGGPDNETSSFSQLVSVSSVSARIDAGQLSAALSAYLGGFDSQEDNATVTATFLNGTGGTISSVSLPAITAADRDSITGVLLRSATVIVPPLTRVISVVLSFTRTDGSYNDGYADNLSLVLSPVVPVLAIAHESGGMKVSWPSIINQTYEAQWSGDLITWTDLANGAVTTGTGAALSFLDPSPTASRRFYRLLLP